MAREGNGGWGLWLLVLLGLAAGPGAALYGRSTATPRAPERTPAAPEALPQPPPSLPGTASAAARREARVAALLRDALGVDDGRVPAGSLGELQARVSASDGLQRSHVSTLIASVPDPRRSLMSLYFDQAVETLVNAAAQLNMTKDRHLFPWGEPAASSRGAGAGGSGAEGIASDDSQTGPGVLLFRAPLGPDRDGKPRSEWLVVLLVGESPVLGARSEDVEEAVRWAKALNGDASLPLRVVGPFFSGSARSLALGLERAAGDTPRVIISGTATDADIQELFAQPLTTFQRTVPLDTELFHFLTCELARRHTRAPVRVAVLSENGTVYGKSIQGQSEATDDCGEVELRSYVFPQHISKLRATHQRDQKSADDATASLRRTLELKLDGVDGLSPDTPRTFSALAPYESDLLLRQLLQRICAEATQYLVLAATDPADVVFLAQQARLYCPGVTLAALGADLLFTHPDLRATFSGLVVASPYPLVFDNAAIAAWRQTTPFSSDVAIGFYNATLASLLGPPPGPVETTRGPLPSGLSVPSLIGYRTPLKERESEPLCPKYGPQLWLTMVANNAYWPLEHRCAIASTSQAYVPADPPRNEATTAATPEERVWRGRPIRPTELASGIFVLLLLAATAQLALSFRDLVRGLTPLRERWSARRADLEPETQGAESYRTLQPFADDAALARGRYRIAQHLTWSCLIGLIVSTMQRLPASGAPPLTSSLIVLGTALAAACVLAALGFALPVCLAMLELLLRFIRHPAPCPPSTPEHTARSQAVTTLFALAAMASLSSACRHYIAEADTLRAEAARLLLVRSVDPLGMSPLLPLVYLALGGYAWGALGVFRLDADRRFAKSSPFPDQIRHEVLHQLIERLRALWRGTHLRPELLTLCAFGLPAAYFWQRVMPSFEGHAYDRLWRLAFLAVCASVVFACVKVALSWRLLARFLRQLAAQPMSDAYDRVASKVAGSFGLQLSGRMPDAREFEVSAYTCRSLATLAQQFAGDLPHGAALAAHRERLDEAARLVEESVRRASLRPPPPHAQLGSPAARPVDGAVLQAQIHEALFMASARVYAVLAELWSLRAKEPLLEEVRKRTDYEGLLPGERNAKLPTASRFMRATSADIYLWTRMAEDFVAMRVVTFVQHSFFQLRNLLIFAITAALTLVLTVASYPLQPARFVTVFAWLLILLVIGVGLTTLVAMERDEILSRLGGSGPGTLSLNLRFIGQLVMYVALPAAIVVASVFPEVTELLFSWLDPLTRLLP